MIEKTMTLVDRIEQRQAVLVECAIVERVRRASNIALDSNVANAALIYDARGRDLLEHIWREYIDVALNRAVPILIYLPTWRVNPERLAKAGLPDASKYVHDAYTFLDAIRASYGLRRQHIYIGGLVGCRGDAYRPEEALSPDDAESFHQEQVNALAETGIDILLGTTLPAVSEAIGIARCMARTKVPYSISFVLRPNGTLLDGTLLEDAVDEIDSAVTRRPIGFHANCLHPSNFHAALTAAECRLPGASQRFMGIQGNASLLSPEELDGSVNLEADDRALFVSSMARLREDFNLSLLGGCCGTDAEYLRMTAEDLLGSQRK